MAIPTNHTDFNKQDYYNCEQCNEEWCFFPADYGKKSDYPTKCPLCSMPLWEMIRDVYKEEGLKAVFKQIYLRFK